MQLLITVVAVSTIFCQYNFCNASSTNFAIPQCPTYSCSICRTSVRSAIGGIHLLSVDAVDLQSNSPSTISKYSASLVTLITSVSFQVSSTVPYKRYFIRFASKVISFIFSCSAFSLHALQYQNGSFGF